MKHLDPILKLLTFLILVLLTTLLVCEHFFYMDSQIFSVITTLLSNVTGALLLHMRSYGSSASSVSVSQPQAQLPAPATTTLTTVEENKPLI